MSNASSADAERQLLAARRSGARLAAVQALYQMEQTEQSTRSVIADFMGDRLGLNDEGEPIEEADPDIFKTIVNGVVEHQEQIDVAIMKRLATGWKIERLDATSRAILRAAVSNLLPRSACHRRSFSTNTSPSRTPSSKAPNLSSSTACSMRSRGM